MGMRWEGHTACTGNRSQNLKKRGLLQTLDVGGRTVKQTLKDGLFLIP
jgi:hypothetical protein